MFPVVGDYVTFRYNPKGDSKIIEICETKKFSDASRYGKKYERTANGSKY